MKSVLSNWINYRRKRFWLVISFLTYTLLGFFVLPMVVKEALIDLVDKRLNRQLLIERVDVNPFSFELVISTFTLKDTDAMPLIQADSIIVNLELSGVFLGALRFKEIVLDKPYVYFERFTTESSRLSNVLDDWQQSADPVSIEATAVDPVDVAGSDALPSFLIDSFKIQAGQVRFSDQVPDESVEVSFKPIDVNILQLSSLPDRVGSQNVKIEIPNDTVIEWQGSLSVAPFSSIGRLAVQSKVARTNAYLKHFLPIEEFTGNSSLTMSYTLGYTDALDLKVDDLGLELTDIKVKGLAPSAEFLSFSKLSMQGGYIRYPEEEAGFSAITLTAPSLEITRYIDGSLNLEQLTLPNTNAGPLPNQSATNSSSANQWAIAIGSIAIVDGELRFLDELTQPNALIVADKVNVEILDLQNTTNAASDIKASLLVGRTGAISVQGSTAMLPDVSVEMGVSISNLAIDIADPYLNDIAEIRLDEGTLAAELNIAFADNDLQISGSSSISNLDITAELSDSKLLSWEKLSVDRFEYARVGSTLHVSGIVLDKLFTKFEIYRDLTTNIENILVVTEHESSDPVEAVDPLNMTFAHTTINQATVDFSDKSLPLPFRTVTTDLNGSIGTISSFSSEAAEVEMEGKVDEFGLSRMNGKIDLFAPTDSMDLVVEFRNLLMTNLSPYSAAFAGRAIEGGKLNLTLNYLIDDGQLIGKNELLLSEFKFGEEVESPDAISLPLDLAVALLTNSDGEIDIELPISGDVNDPEFHIGGVVKEAVKQFLVKIVTAPFRMLGALIGIESNDLGEVKFLGGRSTLSPPEVEQLMNISKVMAKRPELSLIVPGGYDERLDTPVLRYEKLVVKTLARLNLAAGDTELMLDDSVVEVFEVLLVETDPLFDLMALKASFVKSTEDGEDRLDQLAYIAELRSLLVNAEEVSTSDLVMLGEQRQASILTQLSLLDVPEDKIQSGVISAIEFDKDNVGDWMTLKLEVSTR
ncbi:MAG: hypothetical protein ACI9YR_000597 [Bacteroidia bacterium]